MIIARLVLAWLAIALCGAGVVAALRGRGRPVGRIEFFGLSFVVGFGVVGLVSVILMVCGARIGATVPVILCLMGAALVARFRPSWKPGSFDRRLLWGSSLIAAALALGLFGAIVRIDLGWDADAFWNMKARSIARHGTFYNPDFTRDIRPHLHPRYPLLVPAVHAWIYTATGSTAEAPIRLTMWLFFLASLCVMAAALRERLPARHAAWILGIYALTPAVQTGDTGGAGGFCDHPLAVMLLVALLAVKRWLETGDRGSAAMASVALACVSQFKDEGGAMVVVAMALLPMSGFMLRGGRGLVEGALQPLPGLALFLAWMYFKQSLLPEAYGIHASLGIQWKRLPDIAYLLTSHLGRFKEWSLLWPLIAVILCLRFPRPRDPDSILPWMGMALLAVYVGVWMVLPVEDARAAMSDNTKRLILQVLPLFFVWSACRLADFRAFREEEGIRTVPRNGLAKG